MASDLFFNMLFLSILASFNDAVHSIEGHSQAFIQTDNELRYLVDTLHFHEGLSGEGLPDISIADLSEENFNGYTRPIMFEPPMLDFGQHSVGIPHMERVMVLNPNRERSLTFSSISGSTVHFHCSFFQDKVVHPGGNTTFDVVFLARQVGNVENTLYIHTSLGTFQYQVFGAGTPNPYRLRPFLGARLPLNSSFSPVISMHNPYSSPLQVVEMYSSGGDLHLELPSGKREDSQILWEIPPYETKPVMKASFVGRVENNHTAYIRIKTSKPNDDYLILPLEVEVSAAPGLYSPSEILDFGTLKSEDSLKSLDLNLLHSGLKPVHITNVTVSPLNEAIKIEFKPSRVPPDTLTPTKVAKITFTASKASDSKQWRGKILVKTKINLYKLSIPYQANIVFGSLLIDKEITQFFVQQSSEVITRNFNITNTFNSSIVIHSITFSPEVQHLFRVLNFSYPVIIQPQQQIVPFLLQFQGNSSILRLHSSFQLHTNLSEFTVPLVCYDGKLKFIPQAAELDGLDFGTLGMGDHRSMIFTLRNDNPVEVTVTSVTANMDRTIIKLLGVEKGNGTTLTKAHNISRVKTDPILLKPNHYAVFAVYIIAPNQEGFFSREINIHSQYETLKFPISLRTAEGSLSVVPETLIFDHAFPGKISSACVHIQSSFSHPMDVHTVRPLSHQNKFSFELFNQKLQPKSKNNIGKIHFDPRLDCHENCYLGLPTHLAAGHQWLSSLSLMPDVAEIDVSLYKMLRRKWDDLVHAGKHFLNATFQLDTNEVRGFLLRVQAHLHWPNLISKSHLNFPLTQIGNTTIREFILDNPSTLPIIVQILLLSLYPKSQALLDLLNSRVSVHQDKEIFSLSDNLKPDSVFVTYKKAVESYFGLKPHKESVTFILKPGAKVRLRVGFTPKDDAIHSSLVIIRNNFTVIETLIVQGRGGGGILRFGNRKSGSSTPLLFEMTEKHLKDCEKAQSGKAFLPNFTVKRAFTARNTGELGLYIQGFTINGSPCEGYGFKVLNCEGFELAPNTSKKIDIAFTPDFTMSRVQRTLFIHSNLGHQKDNFSIVATLPQGLMALCADALPRPPWEIVLYYISITFMITIFLVSIVAAYCDANRLVQWNPNEFDKSKIFNLSAISSDTGSNKEVQDFETSFDNKRKKESISSGISNPVLSSHNIKTNLQRQTSKDNGAKSKTAAMPAHLLTVNTLELTSTSSKISKRNNKLYKKQNFDLGQSESFVSNGNVENKTTSADLYKASDKSNFLIQTTSPKNFQNKLNAHSKNKEKIPKKELYKQKHRRTPSDNEETSSTTTEGSSPDSDWNEKEQKPFKFIINETKTNKSKKAKIRDLIDGDFELSTQSKTRKKTKVQRHYESSLFDSKVGPLVRPPRYSVKHSSNKHIRNRNCEESSPIWDLPKNIPHDEAFSELALQTESFALKHGPTSYSSIVTNGTSQCSTSKPPGTIGQKKSLFLSPVKLTTSDWQSDASSPIHGTPKTPALPPFSGPIFENGNNSVCSPRGFPFESNSLGYPSESIPLPHSYGGPTWATDSLMQGLQLDRRQHLDQHLLQKGSEEWPGFDLTLPSSESWWDTELSRPHSQPSSVWGQSSVANLWDSSLWSSETSSLSTIPETEEKTNANSQVVRDFDPFNSLNSSIWSPGTSLWTFQQQEEKNKKVTKKFPNLE